MKSLLIIFFLFSSLKSFGCSNTGMNRHHNADSTLGGFVSSTATVSPEVYIAYDAKVCDRALVQGKVFIRNSAEVSGDASIDGRIGKEIIIEGASKVSGRAKIIAGSVVRDSAQIYGSSILEGSTVGSNAKVCDGVYLKDRSIFSDEFCSSTDENIYSSLKLVIPNLSEDKFNVLPRSVTVLAKEGLLSRKIEDFKVTINGEEITSDNFRLYRDQIILTGPGLFQNGQNTVLIEGRDEYNKEIETLSVTYMMGNTSRNIGIYNVPPSANRFEAKIKYHYNDYEYSGKAYAQNGYLALENFPIGIEGIAYEIEVVASDWFIYSKGESIESLPLIRADTLPNYLDNNTRFHNLDSWEVSHPESVVSVDDENGVEISHRHITPFVMKKTFLLNFESGIDLNTTFVSSSMLGDDQIEEILFISKRDRKITSYTFSQSDLPGQESENYSNFQKEISGSDAVTVIFRISGNVSALDERTGNVKVKKIELPKVSVKFDPYNFSIYNNYKNDTTVRVSDGVTFTSPESGNCASFFEDVERLSPIHDPIDSFFSAGSFFNMPDVLENRIYGNLSIKGLKLNNFKVDPEKIKLVISYGYGYSSKISVSLAPCMRSKYFHAGEAAKDIFINKENEKQLAGYLFSVPRLMLSAISTQEGAKVKIHVEVNAGSAVGKTNFFSSRSLILTVLRSPDLSANKVYGCKDSFDKATGNICLRGGGDKWILPAYADTIKSILQDTDWSANDMAKANGGFFKPHTGTHKDGLDVDVKYNGFRFDKIGTLDYASWNEAFDKIENFVGGISTKIPNGIDLIRNIYISSDIDTKIRKAPLYKRFDNRCMEYEGYRRITDLDADNGEGSVMRYVAPHSDHLHIRFNYVTKSGSKGIIPINSDDGHFNNVYLEDFLFSLDEKGKLSVEIKPELINNYKDVMVLWRYQDKEGFTDLSMNMQSGRIGKDKIDFDSVPNSDSSIRYLYVSVARKESGQCGTTGPIEIDVQEKSKMKNGKWF